MDEIKREFCRNYFQETKLVVHTITLYNTHELTCATCLVVCKDNMTDKLTEEKFCQ